MRTQIISKFLDTSAWRIRLYETVYGSAVAGNGDARKIVLSPDAELASRVRVDHPYLRGLALKMAETNRRWQKVIGRLAELAALPDKRIHSLLSCPLPGVYLYDQSITSYPCQCALCPNCWYRQLEKMYKLFAQMTDPGMALYEHTLSGYDLVRRTLKVKLAEHNNQYMGELYKKGRFPWQFGMNLTFPEWSGATDEYDELWRCTTRTLAVVHPDVKVPTGAFDTITSVDGHNFYEDNCRWLGAANPQAVVNAIADGYKYPAALLYSSMYGVGFLQAYSTFHNRPTDKPQNFKRSEFTVCRSRTYGLRGRELELEQKGKIDVTDYKQCISWRSPFTAADLDEQAGDQERCIRFFSPDNRILCGQPGVTGTHG